MEHANTQNGKQFEMPGADATKAERLAAYHRLNAVKLTMDQIERVMNAGDRDARTAAALHEGFADPALALAAMWLRVADYLETRDLGGVDWAEDDPELYQGLATCPFPAEALGLTQDDVAHDLGQASLFG